jgi:hypothetical protein
MQMELISDMQEFKVVQLLPLLSTDLLFKYFYSM